MSTHDRLERIQAQNNQLMMAGKTPEQIHHIAGQLPCYVYDSTAITERISQLRQHLPHQVQLHYAIKANPMPAVVNHIASLVDGLDVASHQEMLTALATGQSPQTISFAGPGKSIQELTAAISANVVINAESELELERITQICQRLNTSAKVAIRVNPDFELKGSGMKMSGGPKQFGIDAEKVVPVIQNLDPSHIEWIGLHIFSGSQNLNADSLMLAHQKTLELAANICQQVGKTPAQLNIGGGFGIPYFPGERHLDCALVCQNLSERLAQKAEILQGCDIHMELGRYLVAEAGTYLCQITDIKPSRGQTYLITNGGMHHHLANSGNFGQVIRRNYPVVIANRLSADQQEQVEIVGPLCTPLDIVAAKISLPKAEVGDYIAVLQSGAYGASASPGHFLSHPDVRELLL